MSSILKALRKLEEEKAARGDGGITDIGREILRPARRRRGTFWREPVMVAGAVLLLAFGGFSLLPWDGGPSAGLHEHPVAISAAPGAQSGGRIASPSGEQIVEQTIPTDVPPSFPAVPLVEAAAVTAASSPPPAAASVPQVAIPDPAADEVVPPPATADPTPHPAEAVVYQVDPAVSVESIIYHPQPEARMAVINGLPVMQGTVIDGTRIEEILTDRVRLSRNGRMFENRVEKPVKTLGRDL